MKPWRGGLSTGAVVVLAVAFFIGANFAFGAQTNRGDRPASQFPFTQIQAFSNNPVALELITNLLKEPQPELSVPEISQTFSPPGTYWTLKNPVPLPFDPFPDLPVYAVSSNGTYLIDNRSVDYAAMDLLNELDPQVTGLTNPTLTPFVINTNGLWVEAPSDSLATPGYFTVMIHNSIQGQSYDVLTKSDLLAPSWATELVVTGAVGNVTQVQLLMNSRANLFVWVRESTAYSFYIITAPLSQYVFDGDTVTFSVGTGGNTNLTYQWTFNGAAIDGATNSSYTIVKVEDSDAGGYGVIISDGTNSFVTADAQLTTDNSFGTEITYISFRSSRQDYTFRSGVTYSIRAMNGPIRLYGHTTIEAGAVLKFDWYYNSSLQIMGTLTCKGEPYNPAILTSVDDETVGYALGYSAYDGPPQPFVTGVPYLDLTCAQSNAISNLRIAYADWGVSTPVISRRLDVWDCQFLQCNYGVVNLVDGTGAVDSLHNVLFSGCGAAVAASTNAIDVEAEQVTADVGDFCLASALPDRIALTNSIVWGNPVTASSLATVNVAFNPDLANFQSADAGIYYLAANSPLHNAGMAGISPRLQTELRNKTTCPPVDIAAGTQISGQITLSPQAARYTNGAPDLGYYYDALDYTVADLILNGGTLTVLPGTAIGCRMEYIPAWQRWSYIGFDVEQNSSVVSQGMPARPNVFVDVQAVQEQTTWPVEGVFVPDFLPIAPGDTPPSLNFRFSNFYLNFNSYINSPAYHFWSGISLYGQEWSLDSLMYLTLQDCQLHGGQVDLGTPDNSDYGFVYGSGAVTLANNLFENVTVDLNPTYYWYNQTVNCDMQIQACNNLFRGGLWFYLEPVPASAGNWVFKDNLFDKVNILQDTSQPLDYDYNGYWPLQARELLWSPDAGQLQPSSGGNLSGSNEKVLATAPPYQAGPFGNYYLPDTTALNGAGSRPPGDAGLYQYTTRLDQVKEGDDTAKANVNIGLHYVAANSNGQPKDTDNDGIPDYAENWHGDGNYSLHTDTETDWQNPKTDGVTPDAYNLVYDDMDLSGDGLNGEAKRFFGVNPLVPSNPLTLASVTSQGVLSGLVQIPLNIGTNVDTNTTILLNINGIVGNTAVIQSNGNWFAQWDTTTVANGIYQVQLEYPIDDDASAFGVTSFVNVQNDVCFPNNLSICGSALFAVPQTVNTNGTFTMDVYDDQTNLVTSVNGSVDADGFCNDPNTGQPGITVDLQDTNGVDLPSTYFTVDVTTWPVAMVSNGKFRANANSSGGHGARRFGHEGPWNGIRGWVMAYMPIYGTDQTPSSTKLDDLMATAAAAVLNQYGTEGILNGEYTTAGGYTSAMALSTTKDWTTLSSLLHDTSSRNFYYFGHAGKALVGSKKNPIYFDQDVLQNVILQNSANPMAPNSLWQHPYRFVFLDGCQTAAGTLPALFGIPNMTVIDDVWNKAGLPPRSFLGWQSYTGTSFKKDGTPISDGTRMRYMNNFWNDWAGGYRLRQALDNANQDNDSNGPFTDLNTVITLYGSPTLPFYQ